MFRAVWSRVQHSKSLGKRLGRSGRHPYSFRPADIPADSARNPLWPSVELQDASAAVMVGGKVFRVIDSRSWDARRRLDDMAIDDIQIQVVSPMPELLSHWFPPADADALCRHVNEGIAALCADHPRHFVGIGMVPMQD